MKLGKQVFPGLVVGLLCVAGAAPARAAQIDTDARSAIPHDVQQLIVVDYRVMQGSSAAMDLKARVLPPELKQLETALKQSGLNENQDVEELAFAAYRTGTNGDDIRIIGIAQGEFQVSDILANFKKNKVKATMIRNNRLYPMGASGMLVTFLNPTTMLFGTSDAIKPALDCRDGLAPSFLTNQDMLTAMGQVDSEPIWSILDTKGTQYMMHSLLGQASQLADYDNVKKRLLNSSYTMDFTNGVKFNLYVSTSDTFTAATMSSLLNAAAMYEKVSGTAIEKQAIDATTIDSTASTLSVKFSTSDSQFSALLQSPLFQNVVR
ncbi:MAG TPA: hypothetical protein VMD92_15425 [Acidobacteriaceae bacterium]|nr:hypothetical protein [Acidobacteriaceae bacterium]